MQDAIEGDLHVDDLHKTIYATDASVYREVPLGVVYPKSSDDVVQIVQWANEQKVALIPRAGGTSLAGQVVGNGLIVDCSKYMNNILEINPEKQWIRIQPGVVLDELNLFLADYGLFFGPETSTSTHCNLGGMFGNNSCGTHSIQYGSTREHVLSANVVLSNGDKATFNEQSAQDFKQKCEQSSFEGKIYNSTHQLLKHPRTQELVIKNYPPTSVIRRNTGYALDFLVNTSAFANNNENFNFCKLLAGSEGTLAFTTELTLNVVPLPPKHKAVVCVQHNSIAETCQANLVALSFNPTAVELMDDVIIKMARQNPIQREQSKFIQGLPKAVLLVEFMHHDSEELQQTIDAFIAEIEAKQLSHYHCTLYGPDVSKVWNLRKAGLGVLGNMAGDKKPVALIEDTAVDPQVLPQYIAEVEEMMANYHKDCVFYAHISAGELHLRPVLNLKEEKDRELFRTIGEESAKLVAKHNGSISGEHGDGRLRGEFIPIQYGQELYGIFQQMKAIFDPNNLFNPNKIVDTPPMDEYLRYEPNQETKEFKTYYDFTSDLGFLRATEKCNGVGYCRKSEKIGGTMCPSYQASRNEKDTTRARANVLREVLTRSNLENPFTDERIADALDLCLSCKGCKTECPSNVDMAKLKAEALQQRYLTEGVPLKTKLIAESPIHIRNYHKLHPLINFALNTPIAKHFMGIAKQRKLPKVQSQTFNQWAKQQPKQTGKTVLLLNDEFSNFYDVDIAKTAYQLLNKLGYQIELLNVTSARTHLSKGLLWKAKGFAEINIKKLAQKLPTATTPLIGLEPSTILAFRDEYIDLLEGDLKQQAKQLADNCLTFEEFFNHEVNNGTISQEQFKAEPTTVLVHGHCQQKALIGNNDLLALCQFLPHAQVIEIPSGCCGMAGSFGYEAHHYDLSMAIGELVLFPAIRENQHAIVVAPGTSCRHQIHDGVQTKALHPAELLYQQLK